MHVRFTTTAFATLLVLGATNAAAGFTEVPQFGAGPTIPNGWGDFDGDGDLDLAVGNFNSQNRLYVNEGGGVFVEEARFGAGATFAVAWGDVDNDGDADLAVGNGSNQQNHLYVNEGGGSFSDLPRFGTSRTNAVAWADVDLDGDLDLAVGNGLLGSAQQNRLYLNVDGSAFIEEGQFGAGQSASIAWADYDQDGDPDLAVGNGGFGSTGPNFLYRNNGDGTWTELPEFGEGDTASVDWGDADNDGDLDLAVGNWNNGQNLLYRNQGDGSFSAEPQFGGRDTNTLSWGDSNNDGLLDVAVGNGDFASADQNYLYLNLGNGSFDEQPQFGLGSTDALAWGDFDGDGDLDLASGNEHSPTQNYLYVNDEDDQDFVTLRLVGHRHDLGPGFSNRNAVGARVSVYESGFVGSADHRLGFREIAAHGGFSAQDDIAAHFGVPGLATVDVRIEWPGSGGQAIVQDVLDVPVAGIRVIDESAGSTGILDAGSPAISRGGLRASPNPMRFETSIALPPGAKADRLVIYDAQGRFVRALQPAPGAGSQKTVWDGRTAAGDDARSGLYWIRLEGGRQGDAPSGRIVLLR